MRKKILVLPVNISNENVDEDRFSLRQVDSTWIGFFKNLIWNNVYFVWKMAMEWDEMGGFNARWNSISVKQIKLRLVW